MQPSNQLSALADLVNGFQSTCLVWTMVELGLVERLAEGPSSLRTLAEELSLQADALWRLLRALSALELVQETEQGDWQLSDRGRLLRTHGWGAGLRAWTELVGQEYLAAWAQLPQAIRQGQPTFPSVFGQSAWQHRAAHPPLQAAFSRLTEGQQKRAAALLLRQVAWRGDERVVDLGGGQIHLLVALLQAHPHLQGCLFDLPPLDIPDAERPQRLTVVEGCFFDSPLPQGEVYLLKHVLHNWDDAQVSRLLERLREQMTTPEHRLLILEHLLAEPPAPSAPSDLMMDLHMLVIQGGRERTLGDFRRLLREAGLQLGQHWPGRPGQPHLLEARRP